MNGNALFLGRSTMQWMGLISALAGTIQTIIIVAFPDVDPKVVAVILGSVTGFLGVLIAFIANTSTTPINDPQLKSGTLVRVTDDTGTVVDHRAI